jgi:hypothetical protein
LTANSTKKERFLPLNFIGRFSFAAGAHKKPRRIDLQRGFDN